MFVDDAIIVELSNKSNELQAIIDSLMSAEQSGTMLDALAQNQLKTNRIRS
jgi:hypothetical protein